MAERALGDHGVAYDSPGEYAQIRDIVGMINKLTTLVNELRDDHATNKTELEAIGTTLADIKTQFDAHTHTQENGDGSQTSTPDDTVGGIATAGTDRVITDASGSPAATLTAAAADSGTWAQGDTPT